MDKHFRFLPTGDRLFVGQLAGRELLDTPGHFSSIRHGQLGHAPAGARAAATTHGKTLRAPKASAQDIATFHCPMWPECACPGGTMRPECPGLQSQVDAE